MSGLGDFVDFGEKGDVHKGGFALRDAPWQDESRALIKGARERVGFLNLWFQNRSVRPLLRRFDFEL